MGKILAVLVCAALSAREIQDFVRLAQQDGWDVWVIATPNAQSFINEPLLVQLTQHPVLITAPLPLQPALPPIDAAIVVPATFQTLKKWVQGLTDTYVVELLCQWTANLHFPVLVFPRASAELAQDPDFEPSLVWLRRQGVQVFYLPERYPPNNNISWSEIIQRLRQAVNTRERPE